ncbi:MAG: hypothetical protein OXE74_01320 [Cyanobacteria bacterium MAG CAR2_bin_4]|nr:hypothetical protein [Cyanobacteria bacterium MAG CAR2_bin_4]
MFRVQARPQGQLQLRLQEPIAALAAAAPDLDPRALWPETLGPSLFPIASIVSPTKT